MPPARMKKFFHTYNTTFIGYAQEKIIHFGKGFGNQNDRRKGDTAQYTYSESSFVQLKGVVYQFAYFISFFLLGDM
jgi:hypothetical protein